MQAVPPQTPCHNIITREFKCNAVYQTRLLGFVLMQPVQWEISEKVSQNSCLCFAERDFRSTFGQSASIQRGGGTPFFAVGTTTTTNARNTNRSAHRRSRRSPERGPASASWRSAAHLRSDRPWQNLGAVSCLPSQSRSTGPMLRRTEVTAPQSTICRGPCAKREVYTEKCGRNGPKLSMYRVFEGRCIPQGTYLSDASQPSAIANFD